MSVFLRDTSAPAGTPETVRFDFVGSDSVFTNEFNAGGEAIKRILAHLGLPRVRHGPPPPPAVSAARAEQRALPYVTR